MGRAGEVETSLAFLDEEEATHELVVYVADPDPGSLWTRRAVRQADLVLAVADAEQDPATASARASLDSVHAAVPGGCPSSWCWSTRAPAVSRGGPDSGWTTICSAGTAMCGPGRAATGADWPGISLAARSGWS